MLKPLGYVTGVVERRQTLPVLSNVLIRSDGENLSLTGTDLEVEVVAAVKPRAVDEGTITVPARKLYDICRALPAGAEIKLEVSGEKAVLRSGKSRFTLLTLPGADFPNVEVGTWDITFTMAQEQLKRLLERTQFCMAHQDVRYYLNGLLLELGEDRLRAVATDGHRMGLSEVKLSAGETAERQAIVPRKGALEVGRFLAAIQETTEVRLSPNHIRVSVEDITLTSKLVDGRFPDYTQVISPSYQQVMRIGRAALGEALGRVAILANEKYHGARFTLQSDLLVVTAHNAEQEEAKEEIAASYGGKEIEIGFNVNYFIDAVNALEGEEIELGVNDPNSSCVLQSPGSSGTRYIVMPMRL